MTESSESSQDIFETDAELMAEERRVVRDSLFLAAELRVAGYDDPFQVRVRNLSAGGLMAELAAPVEAGTALSVELRGIGRVTGTIAWMAEGRIGVAFDKPINPQLARKPVVARPVSTKISRPL